MFEDFKKGFQKGQDSMVQPPESVPAAPPSAPMGFSFPGFGMNPYQSNPTQQKDLKVLAR